MRGEEGAERGEGGWRTVEGAGERGKGRGGRRETQFYTDQVPIDRFSGFYL